MITNDKKILIRLLIFLIGVNVGIIVQQQITSEKIIKEVIRDTVSVTDTVIVRRYKGDMKKFMDKLFTIEGLGVSDTVNRYGHLGKYQFHPKTLRAIGFNVPDEVFLSNVQMQDSALVELLRRNSKILKKVIQEWDQKYYNGIFVTKSGILAAAHLVGPGGVLAYFYPETYNHSTIDANGTSVEDYLRKFGGYRLKL
jgi:hypothetical protein